MSRPLRSTPITGASSLLRVGPPASFATGTQHLRFPPSVRSLSHQPRPRRSTPQRGQQTFAARLPTFHADAADRAHATPTPDTTWPTIRATARLIPGTMILPGFDVTMIFTTLNQWIAHARLPDPHLTHHVRLFLIAHHDGL